jgi:ribosomal protein S16
MFTFTLMIIRKKFLFTGMKKFYFFIFLFISSSLFAQNFNGQWKGSFDETSYGFSGLASNVDYVLELQTSGSNVSGYSYTYFNEGQKRYYTICKLTGTLDRATNEIVVTEIERVKFNTPPDFQNCFQIHKLHYVQDSADIETLRGTWMPAPNQTGNCGYGTTFLSRRIVKKLALGSKPSETKKEIITRKNVDAKKENNTKKITALKPKSKPPDINKKSVAPKTKEAEQPIVKKEENIKDMPSSIPDLKKDETVNQKPSAFEPRRKDIIKTIPITQPTFKVDFYDNGVVDGDSITVFYNGKILLSHKMLTTNAISLTLSLDENIKENIITMYADNLGTIPPNTALMIVTDGDKRYEVHISSDTEKSGSVIFVHGNKSN